MYWKQIVTFVGAAGTAALAMGVQERQIERSGVPEAVLKAVEARYRGATLREFEIERENGRAASFKRTRATGPRSLAPLRRALTRG